MGARIVCTRIEWIIINGLLHAENDFLKMIIQEGKKWEEEEPL